MLKALRPTVKEFIYRENKSTGRHHYFVIDGIYKEGQNPMGSVATKNKMLIGIVYTQDEEVPKQVCRDLNDALRLLGHANDTLKTFGSPGAK